MTAEAFKADIEEKVANGQRLSYEDGVALYDCDDLNWLGRMAHKVRTDKNGERVMFVFDWAVFAWAFVMALITAVAFGLAPALFAACIYVCLGRIIQSVDAEQYSLIRLSILTKFFVAGDILGLAIQGAGK